MVSSKKIKTLEEIACRRFEKGLKFSKGELIQYLVNRKISKNEDEAREFLAAWKKSPLRPSRFVELFLVKIVDIYGSEHYQIRKKYKPWNLLGL